MDVLAVLMNKLWFTVVETIVVLRNWLINFADLFLIDDQVRAVLHSCWISPWMYDDKFGFQLIQEG